MGVDVVIESNALELERYFGTVNTLCIPYAAVSLQAGGELIVEKIKTSISIEGLGEPSPEGGPPYQQTGDYEASWQGPVPFFGPGLVGVVLGTDAPQGARLEHGFDGEDSLGRVYNQAPRPHVGPAVDEVEPLVADDLLDRLLTLGPAR